VNSPTVARPLSRVGGVRWAYFLYFAVENLGVLLFYFKALPHFRQTAAKPSLYEPRDDVWWWSLLVIVLIQVGYWGCFRLQSAMPKVSSAFLGHLLLFFARLVFLLPSAYYTFTFLYYRVSDRVPVQRRLMLFPLLFSLFCYMLQVQRIGNSMMTPEKDDRRTQGAAQDVADCGFN